MRKILGICCAGLLLAVLVQGRLYQRSREENRRLEDNQKVLFSETVFYRTKDSLSVADVERLTLSNREFSRYCSELKQTVEKLRLKVRDLQSVSRTVTESYYPVQVVVRDSILPGKKDTLKCVDYHDAYLTFSGCIEKQTFHGEISTRDTLVQVVYRVPRKFLFIRWGTKAIRQKILSCNPYNRIVYDEYIELKRR